MDSDCGALIADRIRQRGPVTVAEFMDLALYAPEVGYYARAAQRSGRTGDFFTSVDTGPIFGALLAEQFAAWWRSMGDGTCGPDRFDLVEAGAGNGRLSRDILDTAAHREPAFYRAVSLHLVERSAQARAAHASTLAAHAPKLAYSGDAVPDQVQGVVFANELLDAFPVHVVQQAGDGLVEIYVDLDGGHLVVRPGPLSTGALASYLADADITLGAGARAEINLAASAWVTETAGRLRRGFLVLIDYGYEAGELYSAARARGTLASYHRHLIDAPGGGAPGRAPWLADPGSRDLTSHVDFTSVRRAAERAGLVTAGMTAQTRFLLDVLERSPLVAELSAPDRLADRLALKTLLLPGGLGSTHTVMVFTTR